MTMSMAVGPMPEPVAAPPAVVFDEVTNGYVPWSRSRAVPWAPSKRTRFPPRIACMISRPVSVARPRRRSPAARAASTSDSSCSSCSSPPPPMAAMRARARWTPSSARARARSPSARSTTRRPRRPAFSSYAGPMPRPVVPIFCFALSSETRSRTRWYGMRR